MLILWKKSINWTSQKTNLGQNEKAKEDKMTYVNGAIATDTRKIKIQIITKYHVKQTINFKPRDVMLSYQDKNYQRPKFWAVKLSKRDCICVWRPSTKRSQPDIFIAELDFKKK